MTSETSITTETEVETEVETSIKTENEEEMASETESVQEGETSDSPLKYWEMFIKGFNFVLNDYPDCPQKTEDVTVEDYIQAVKEYFQTKGLRHFDDFSDSER